MLYSSGTTGRPKGALQDPRSAQGDSVRSPLEMGDDDDGVGTGRAQRVPLAAPLYHSAPLFYCMSTLRLGATVVVMEQFDPEAALEYIERYRVTHSQWVPTMFVRMLKLPTRTRHDLSSMKVAIHAAAPCSVEVKRKMIEWWGPIIDEYYAATEACGRRSSTAPIGSRTGARSAQCDVTPDPHPRRRRRGSRAPLR